MQSTFGSQLSLGLGMGLGLGLGFRLQAYLSQKFFLCANRLLHILLVVFAVSAAVAAFICHAN